MAVVSNVWFCFVFVATANRVGVFHVELIEPNYRGVSVYVLLRFSCCVAVNFFSRFSAFFFSYFLA